jgi:tetratricopeptide (TPR) repeat protein
LRAALLVIVVAVPPVLSLFEEPQERSVPALRALLASLPTPTRVVPDSGPTPLALDPLSPAELLEYQRWLRAERFDSLEGALRMLRAQMAADVRSEGRYVSAYAGLSHLGLRRAVDRWVEVHPEVPEARLVRAELLTTAAGQRRGGDASWMTSDQQFAAMLATQDSALADLRVVLARDPADIGAHWALLPIARMFGAVDDIHVITARAVALAPTAYFVRFRAMLALLPRWGGSYEEMQWLAAEAQQYAAQNPELRALQGFVDWDRANIAARRNDTAAAFRHARASLRHGQTFRLCADHARRLIYYGRVEEAREAARCAEAIRPSYAETRALLGNLYLMMGRRDYTAEGERYRALAETESKLALRLDPSDNDALRLGTKVRESRPRPRTNPSPVGER